MTAQTPCDSIALAAIFRGLADVGSVTALKIAFFVLAALFFRQLLVSHGTPRPAGRLGGGGTWPVWILFWTILLLFVGVFAYQGTWQVAGFMRPAFLDFMKRYSHRPFNPAKQVSRGRILDRKGVILARNDAGNVLKRRYPLGPACAHVVGYVDARYGLSGLEAADNPFLCGYTRATRTEWNRLGLNLLNPQSVRGNDLVTTLDSDLQCKAYELLRGRAGAVVALRPSDGAVLALVSSPSFTPEDVGEGIRRGEGGVSPMFNRATQGLYPPGSTFKVLVSAAALEAGFRGSIHCPPEGYVPAPGCKPIRDHEYYEGVREDRAWGGHGTIGLDYAFRKSSNVFFARLGVHLGGPRIRSMAERMMLTDRIGLFAGASGSLSAQACAVPSLGPDNVRQTAQTCIGQGELLVTPLHMAMMAACVAADGRLYAPRLSALQPPAPPRDVFAPGAARELQRLMRETVMKGTAAGADVPGLDVAGKTGTAQNPAGEDHSWFICFAPVDRPLLALAVLVEHGGFGARAAVPLAADLLREAQEIGLFKPVVRTDGPPAGGAP